MPESEGEDVAASVTAFIVAADENGAVVLDPETQRLLGYARGRGPTALWSLESGADRKFVVCGAAGCPSVVASGAYTVQDGPQPDAVTVRIDAAGRVSTQPETTEHFLDLAGGVSATFTPESPAATAGELTLTPSDGVGSYNFAIKSKPLWFPARNGLSGLVQTAPSVLLQIEYTGVAWRYIKLQFERPIASACLDPQTQTVVAGAGADLLVNGKVLGQLEGDQMGGCEVRGAYLLASSYSSSTAEGPQTSLELWRLGAKGVRLWSRQVESLTVPAFVGDLGTVAVASGGELQEIDVRGVEQTTPNVIDMRATTGDQVTILRSDLRVLWRAAP